jgi:hypothetical protein
MDVSGLRSSGSLYKYVLGICTRLKIDIHGGPSLLLLGRPVLALCK